MGERKELKEKTGIGRSILACCLLSVTSLLFSGCVYPHNGVNSRSNSPHQGATSAQADHSPDGGQLQDGARPHRQGDGTTEGRSVSGESTRSPLHTIPIVQPVEYRLRHVGRPVAPVILNPFPDPRHATTIEIPGYVVDEANYTVKFRIGCYPPDLWVQPHNAAYQALPGESRDCVYMFIETRDQYNAPISFNNPFTISHTFHDTGDPNNTDVIDVSGNPGPLGQMRLYRYNVNGYNGAWVRVDAAALNTQVIRFPYPMTMYGLPGTVSRVYTVNDPVARRWLTQPNGLGIWAVFVDPDTDPIEPIDPEPQAE